MRERLSKTILERGFVSFYKVIIISRILSIVSDGSTNIVILKDPGEERLKLRIVMQSLVPEDFKRLKVNPFRGRRKKLDFA